MNTKMKLIFLSVLMAVCILPLAATFPGNCLSFADGKYVTGSGLPTTLSAVTLEGWVNHTDLSGSYQRYLSIGNEVAVIRLQSGSLHFYIKNSAGTFKHLTANVMANGEWLHVAGTYDGTTQKLYLNGNLLSSQTVSPGGLTAPDGTFGFSKSGEAMHGKLDDFRFWNVARTQDQIRANRFVELTGSETGLQAYWKMDSSSGSTVYDVKGAANGTASGMGDSDWVASTVPTVTFSPAYAFSTNASKYAPLQLRSGLPIYNNGTSNAYSISMWIKGAASAGYNFYAENNLSNTNAYFRMATTSGGNVAIFIGTDSGGGILKTTNGVAFDNTWHHIAWVDNNGTASFYIDGVADGGSFNYTRGTTTLNAATIGAARNPNVTNAFTGQMDEICMWNVALSSSQVMQSMNYPSSPNASGLVAYFQANEGSGKVGYDVCRGNNAIFVTDQTSNWAASSAPIGQYVGGTISSNTTWNANSQVYITSNVTVNNGVTLTVDPGTYVYAKGSYAITVLGRLLAVGTEANNITFTANGTTGWRGIRLDNTPSTNDSTKIVYCRLENGKAAGTGADYSGGAIYIYNFSKTLIKNSVFDNNRSNNGYDGGAIYLSNCYALIEQCTFTNNYSADSGGAIGMSLAQGLIVNCVFRSNSCATQGGAIWINNPNSDVRFQNCIFYDNTAGTNGGAISLSNLAYAVRFYNCTIWDNNAVSGGGVEIASVSTTLQIKLANSILWDNTASSNGSQIAVTATTQIFLDLDYTDIQNGTDGIYWAAGSSNGGGYNGCWSLDPQMSYSAANPASGFVLAASSPCINNGYNYTGLPTRDVNKNLRFYDNTMATGNLNTALDRIDVGAIEDQSGNAVLPGGVTISSNATITKDMYLHGERGLTINAGITLSFSANVHFNISGNLTAIGTLANKITFTEAVSGSGWGGFTFSSTGSAPYPSSRMEYCVIEKGVGDTWNEAWGGNVHLWFYNSLTMKSCLIRNGSAEIGGALYSRGSTWTMTNCVVADNVCSSRGPGIYSNAGTVKVYNCTFANNLKTGSQEPVSYLACAYFNNVSTQPDIKNSILWNNGNAAIYSESGTLTNVSYCDIDGGYSGTGNINVNPRFTGETNHPYNIYGWSFCLNTAKADTTGLSLPTTDLKGNARIFSHTNTSHNRVDMGAYEYPGYLAPADVVATDGNNNYPGYVYITWDYNTNYNIAPSGFRIFRNGAQLDNLDPQTRNYSDNNALPGTIYNYQVQAYYGSDNGNSAEETGYVKPNGVISGHIKTTNNNPVMGVKISLSPSQGRSVQLSAANSSSISITNPQANLNQNFTIEIWIKTAVSNITLLSSGTHLLKINSSGLVQYTDGLHTLTQTDTSISATNNSWHHIAVVSNYTDNQVLMYLDDKQVALGDGYRFGNYVQSNFLVPIGFTGYLDDIRVWTAARDSSEVVDGRFIVMPYNSNGLKGYWALNEGTGTDVFDATTAAHNGVLSNCTWINSDAGMQLGALSDAWGDYLISEIPYGSSTTFSVTPTKTGHMFQPEQRLITLSSSNIAANNVDFTDNSMIPISGYVMFQYTSVPVEGAVIELNGSAAVPRVVTDEEGYYVMDVEHGTACVVSTSYKGHEMNRSWDLGNVTFPRTNINIYDTFKTDFQLDVVGGQDSYPIGDFNVTVASVDGLYTKQVNNANWASGGILVTYVPPLEYNVTVNPGTNDPFDLVVDDQFQSMKTKNFSLVDADTSIDTLRFEWRAPLQIEVAWDDSLGLRHFDEYPEAEFRVLTQNEWYSAHIKALEDYSFAGHPDQKTYLDNCKLIINDEVGTKGYQEKNFDGETDYEYTFAPYLPNIQSDYDRQYQKLLEFSVRDEERNRFATEGCWILTQGIKPMESTYATTSPEIPLLVLHDPPGDGSQVTYNQSHTHTTTLSTSVVTNQELNMSVTSHMGPDFTFEAGTPFFSKETEIDITADFSDNWEVEMKQTDSKEQKYTFTTSTELATSSSSDIIGAFGADVFMGAAVNLLWGETKEVYWDYENDTVSAKTGIMVTPTGFGTQYIYTESQIRNSVIPNLEAIGDTTSANMWRSYLDMNDYNIEHAEDHPDFVDNVSFCSGPSYTLSSAASKSSSKKFEWEVSVSREFGMKIGETVDGIGTEAEFKFKAGITLGHSNAQETEESTTTTILFADDDVASDLTFNSDYFTVSILKDKVYGTPVFNLISGASSSHWEPNTQPRDGVMLTANTYTASNIPQDQPAVFLLYLSNTSQTNEPRRYFLTAMHATNNIGALIKINGVPLENAMAFDIDAGATVEAVMTVEPGPMGYELEGLTLEFYAAGDRGYEGPEDHYFDIFKSFNIFWEAPYSRVAIGSPQENWLINQANNDQMPILLRDYNLNKPNFSSLILEYKEVSSLTWLPAMEIPRDSLLAHPSYYIANWDVSGLSDGTYQIRAGTTDDIQANWYTASLTGIIDRSSPQVLGLPQPADGIMQLGDMISITFNEDINPQTADYTNVTLQAINTSLLIDSNIQCYNNHITIVPRIANYWMENKTLRATVSGITDIHGNPMAAQEQWEFFVNANPVNWSSSKVELVKPIGNAGSFSTVLINTGGQQSTFTLDDLPVWLTAYPMTGQLLALDSMPITFSISSQLGFGVFTDTLYADIPGLGREPLVVKVSVLANPPAWSAGTTNNFEYSMTITGKLDIDGSLSADPNDIIGAFIQNQQGNYECRGVATPEYVNHDGGSYQFFLTVQSDNEEGEPLIFRVWDASQCKEHYGITEEFTFYSGFVHGTPLSPITVHVSPQLINNISCKTGWTWLSTNLLDQQSMALNHILGSIDASNNDIIKSQTQYAQYAVGSGWVGSLDSLFTTKAYKLKVAANSNLQIIGLLENPNTTPISYGSGWNWISYLPHVSISVNEALANISNLSSGDIIKNQRAYAQYISGYGWTGSLRFMNPGDGYMLKTANPGSFCYPDYQVTRSWERYRDPEPIVQIPGWNLDPLAYEYSANLTGVIQQSGINVGLNYVLGAFVGNECRGIAEAIEVMGTNMYFLTLYANTLNETLSFKVYDSISQTIVNLPVSLPFVNNQITGNPAQPFVFQMPSANLESPKNLKINLVQNCPKLSWDAVAGAASYRVYKSADPFAASGNWILAASGITSTNWTDTYPNGVCFYRVIAVSGIYRNEVETPEKPKDIHLHQTFETTPDNSLFAPYKKP